MGLIKRDTINAQIFDKYLSKILSWNVHYHATTSFQKCAPGSIFYIVKKRNYKSEI